MGLSDALHGAQIPPCATRSKQSEQTEGKMILTKDFNTPIYGLFQAERPPDACNERYAFSTRRASMVRWQYASSSQ